MFEEGSRGCPRKRVGVLSGERSAFFGGRGCGCIEGISLAIFLWHACPTSADLVCLVTRRLGGDCCVVVALGQPGKMNGSACVVSV